MPAYVIIEAHVTDPKRYDAYKRLAALAEVKYGAKFIARGGTVDVLEGDWKPPRLVLIEFKDRASAHRWYESPEYQTARKERLGAADFRCVVTEGVEKRPSG